MRNCGKKRFANALLALGVFIAFAPAVFPAQSSTPRDHFTAGMRASRQGDHSNALQHFNKALAGGMHTAALYYNIGVTNYRLGYLNQAASAFKRAAQSPKMAALACYNLGLIARNQNNLPLAADYFRQAELAANTENLRKLSRYALEEIAPQLKTLQDKGTATAGNRPEKKRGLLWLELSSGYDDNVLLKPEENPSGEDDTLAGIMLFGHYYVTGNHRHGLRVYGFSLRDRHANLDGFDLDITAAGADFAMTAGQRRHNLDLMLLQTSLGGDKLEEAARLTFSTAAMPAPGLQLKFQLGYESINAAPAYEYLDGSRQTGGIILDKNTGNWKLEYNLEFNDREDFLTENGEFQSFSPDRQELVFKKRMRFGDTWTLELESAFRQSRYRGENTQPDGTRKKREDEQASLIAGLYKTWINDWRLGMELSHMENDSNLDEHDYVRSAFILTLDKTFRF